MHILSNPTSIKNDSKLHRTKYKVKDYLTAKAADDDYSAVLHSERSTSTVHSHDERAPDEFAIGSRPRRETCTSNIVFYCVP